MQISKEEYQKWRPLLFSIGYRMTGSVSDTEDLVQKTFLKAYQLESEPIENKRAYLCKIMTNRCLDLLKSSKVKREQYVGPWNPEPLLLERSPELTPPEVILQKEGLSIAYLRMMEHLSPEERAVLLLREVFAFSYSEISNIIEKKEENCRKIFSRAKRKIANVEGESLHYERNKTLIDRFIQAFEKENMEVLLELLSENVTLYSDGGGKVRAALRPIQSSAHVLAFFYGILKKAPADFSLNVENVNGQPAILIHFEGKLQSVISLYIQDRRIQEVYMTVNPEKLHF